MESLFTVSSTQVESARGKPGSRWVRPSVPQDGPAIVELMRQAGLQPHVEPEHLDWKYWRERADGSGPRSYVLTDGSTLLAHGAAVPGTLCWSGGRSRAIHMIDWGARREAIGAGIFLMNQIGRLTDVLFGVGGSNDTLTIMPRIGYQPRGSVTGYVRTLAPLGILRRPSASRWKRLPRMGRSVLWCMSAPRGDLRGWAVRRLGADEVEQVEAVLPQPRAGLAVFERDAALLRHALACPIVPVELYALERSGRIGGYFLLSYAPGQARLADCWMASEDPADWRALAHAAVREARRHGGMAELVAWASDPGFAQVLQSSGFHERLTLPIHLRSSGREAAPQQTLRIQMLDSDAFYLYIGGNELWA